MVPGAHRMRQRGDFTAAVRQGRRAGRPRLVIHMLQRESSEEPARVGFVVSRSVGNAVVRNRVLRRLRHLMRGRIDRLPHGSLLVVRANPAAVGASSAEFGSDLDKALDRVSRPRAEVAR